MSKRAYMNMLTHSVKRGLISQRKAKKLWLDYCQDKYSYQNKGFVEPVTIGFAEMQQIIRVYNH